MEQQWDSKLARDQILPCRLKWSKESYPFIQFLNLRVLDAQLTRCLEFVFDCLRLRLPKSTAIPLSAVFFLVFSQRLKILASLGSLSLQNSDVV